MPSQFAEGNQYGIKHGAEGALVRLRRGLPFLGIALEEENQVKAELGVDLEALSGIDRIMVTEAIRMETVTRLFYYAALGAAEAGELDRWERYCQRYGWIAGKAMAALREVKDLLERDVVTDYEMLLERGDGG